MSAGFALRSFRVARSPATMHIESDNPNTIKRLVRLIYVGIAAIFRLKIYKISPKKFPGIKHKT